MADDFYAYRLKTRFMTALLDCRTNPEVGSRLRIARRHAGLSQEALAPMLKHTQPWVSKVEAGTVAVEMPDLLAWLDACMKAEGGRTMQEVVEQFEGETDPPPWGPFSPLVHVGPYIMQQLTGLDLPALVTLLRVIRLFRRLPGKELEATRAAFDAQTTALLAAHRIEDVVIPDEPPAELIARLIDDRKSKSD